MSKKEKITPYNEIRSSLQTFDILNCIPGGGFFGWFWALIGHTAMVYVCKETGQVMIYESTQTFRKDGRTGVQLRPMREWLANYSGKVFLRRVTIDSRLGRINSEIKCADHIKEFRGTKYPNLKKVKWLLFLANSAVDLPNWIPWKKKLENPDIDTVMFCTQLLGHTFRWCDILRSIWNPAEMEPDDIRPGKDGWFIAGIEDGVLVGPEIQLK